MSSVDQHFQCRPTDVSLIQTHVSCKQTCISCRQSHVSYRLLYLSTSILTAVLICISCRQIHVDKHVSYRLLYLSAFILYSLNVFLLYCFHITGIMIWLLILSVMFWCFMLSWSAKTKIEKDNKQTMHMGYMSEHYIHFYPEALCFSS